MKKKARILSVTLVATLMLMIFPAKSDDIIRYTNNYEMYTVEEEFVPSVEDMQEWWNIDLPRDENNNPLYTLEFNTEGIDFSKPGEYDVVLTFYKKADHKFQKTFKLSIIEPAKEKHELIGKIEKYYIKQIGGVVGIGILLYFLILLLMKYTTKKDKYVLIYDNKIIKTFKWREMPNIEKILKKINISEATSCIVLNKEDVPVYLEQMLKDKKYDYIIELKK